MEELETELSFIPGYKESENVKKEKESLKAGQIRSVDISTRLVKRGWVI